MLRILKRYYPVRNALFVVGEGLFIFLSVIIASWLMIGNNFIIMMDPPLLLKTLLIASVCQLCLYYNDLYDLNVTCTYQELFIRLLQALGASAIILAFVYFIFPFCIIGKGIFIVSICFVVVFIVAWRVAYTHVLNNGLFNKKILLLGSGELSKNIAQEISENKDCGYQVVAIIKEEDNAGESMINVSADFCTTGYDDLCKNVKALNVDKIVVALEERRTCFPLYQLLQCR